MKTMVAVSVAVLMSGCAGMAESALEGHSRRECAKYPTAQQILACEDAAAVQREDARRERERAGRD